MFVKLFARFLDFGSKFIIGQNLWTAWTRVFALNKHNNDFTRTCPLERDDVCSWIATNHPEDVGEESFLSFFTLKQSDNLIDFTFEKTFLDSRAFTVGETDLDINTTEKKGSIIWNSVWFDRTAFIDVWFVKDGWNTCRFVESSEQRNKT